VVNTGTPNMAVPIRQIRRQRGSRPSAEPGIPGFGHLSPKSETSDFSRTWVYPGFGHLIESPKSETSDFGEHDGRYAR
jgi:hypothetical protein